jgi:type I restriction enzyme M protein
VNELVLPIPADEAMRYAVVEKVKRAIHERMEARELARQACLDIVDEWPISDETATC